MSCVIIQILIPGYRMLLYRQLFTAWAEQYEKKIREDKLKPSTFIECILKVTQVNYKMKCQCKPEIIAIS